MPETPGAGVTVDVARETGRPPRDDLVRAVPGGVTLRAVAPPADDGEPSANANGMPTLYGRFTPFNEWTEIDSWYEGNFMERTVQGAFKKTFREQTPKVLFQHGQDPQVGDKPLGLPDVLREDDLGPYYEVPLLDTTYVRDIVPGLEAGAYGASYRFSVMREEYVEEPGVSDYNPKGLPERTIKEVRCSEFGPVTFPAFSGATAGVRSMSDEYLAARMTSHPDRLRALLEYLEARDKLTPAIRPDDEHPADCAGCEDPDCAGTKRSTSAPSGDAETESHLTQERRDTTPPQTGRRKSSALYGAPHKETNTWRL